MQLALSLSLSLTDSNAHENAFIVDSMWSGSKRGCYSLINRKLLKNLLYILIEFNFDFDHERMIEIINSQQKVN